METTEQRIDRMNALLVETYAQRFYTQADALKAIYNLFRAGIQTDKMRAQGRGRNWRVVLLPPIEVVR